MKQKNERVKDEGDRKEKVTDKEEKKERLRNRVMNEM